MEKQRRKTAINRYVNGAASESKMDGAIDGRARADGLRPVKRTPLFFYSFA
jgi:hypothetical protein